MNKTFNATFLIALQTITRETEDMFCCFFLFFLIDLLFWLEFGGGGDEYEEENKERLALEKPPASCGISVCHRCCT